MSQKLPLSIAPQWDAQRRRLRMALWGAAVVLLLGAWAWSTSLTLAQSGDLIPPSDIQGSGAASPLVGASVVTWGRVTGLTEAGFFLQAPTDVDTPQSSDGLYVYTYRAPVAEFGVALGDCLRVQGKVAEFYGKTELTYVDVTPDARLCADAPIAPVDLPPLHVGDDPALRWEPFEGMLVRLAVDEAIVQGPTKTFASGEVEIALLPAHLQRRLGPVHLTHDQPETMALLFLSNRLGATLPALDWGEHLVFPPSGLVGVLDYAFGKYQLLPLPDQALTLDETRIPLGSSAPSVRADAIALPPARQAAEYGVCSYNVHGLGRGLAQHATDEAYAEALRRTATTIATSLGDCTILALQETGTPADARALATMLAADHGLNFTALAEAGPASADREFPLTNSLLVDATRVEVLAVEQLQSCSAQDFGVAAPGLCPAGRYPLFDRPPLAAQVAIRGAWATPVRLWVISNHWKSKAGDERANAVWRMAQAEAVAAAVTRLRASLQAEGGALPVIVTGDLNEFYGGPAVETLRAQSGLVQSYAWLPPADRYTYIFNGAAQVLDHMLLDPALVTQVAQVQILHIHVDFAAAPSDHDPVRLRLRPAGAATLGGTLGLAGIGVTARAVDDPGLAQPLLAQPVLAQPVLAQTVTDAQGFFRLWGLPPGPVQLQFDLPPWIVAVVPDESLPSESLTVTLDVQPGDNGLLELPQVAHQAVLQSLWLAEATLRLVEPEPPTAAR